MRKEEGKGKERTRQEKVKKGEGRRILIKNVCFTLSGIEYTLHIIQYLVGLYNKDDL